MGLFETAMPLSLSFVFENSLLLTKNLTICEVFFMICTKVGRICAAGSVLFKLYIITFILVKSLMFLYFIYVLAVLIPVLAIGVRRLRDMGRRWTSYFINLIPCVGTVIFIIYLTKPSIPDDGTPVV